MGQESVAFRPAHSALFSPGAIEGQNEEMTKIESVSSCAVSLPLDQVTSFSTRTVSERHYLLVKVRGDDGAEGIGFCYVGSTAGQLGTVAVREALDPEVLLMLDANNAWRDLPTALEYLRRYEPYEPYWIEEPFPVDDIDNHARLAENTPVTVATGEIEAGRWRFLEILEKDAAGILQTDAAVCGGITEFRRIVQTAASFGVPVCPHWFHDLHVHLVAALPNCPFVEYFPDDQVLNFRKLLDRQLERRGGDLVVPTDPGLGFGFDEKVVEAHAIVPWAETR